MQALVRASLTSGTLYTIGDLLNQGFVEPRVSGSDRSQFRDVDWLRTGKFALTGALLHGPFFLYGFTMLDRLCGQARSLGAVFKKSVAGQVLLFPPYVLSFLSMTALLDGQSPWDRIQSRFVPIMVNGSIVWPIANVINFRYLPSQWRIAYINIVGIGWNTYLSFNTRQHTKRAIQIPSDLR
ncbi:uncharacterized protein SPPG_05961 [Spizellomyces punctatus DAOM BR117]|uniref:Uncharacterized protein n=1 Tax=Spizellomyces punctatus (strain DAOM BR117) TaxID=645134 RepID=A0A0L0HDD1_SPIPD|nr:uncharacterized protein SPPG_05961 [Spizellomyces punctatus DAOM BR117]KNC99011.1 hypothetical protein SPPG_05961 [Spizellomyces punctatus DAOM BR117]|eukprot:XP_016607051.1 hypothetical protein SPPG_05961 [Spizellomyces punctatus DAOM BR117]